MSHRHHRIPLNCGIRILSLEKNPIENLDFNIFSQQFSNWTFCSKRIQHFRENRTINSLPSSSPSEGLILLEAIMDARRAMSKASFTSSSNCSASSSSSSFSEVDDEDIAKHLFLHLF